MSYVEDLIDSYRRYVRLPWQDYLAGDQKVWMVVYPPEYERRIRLHAEEFATATAQAGHAWHLIDITTSFERWLGTHEYAADYFAEPELLNAKRFFDHLVAEVRDQLADIQDPNAVAGLLGAGTLFGLGDHVKVSAMLSAVSDQIAGRLLVFFPGQYDVNSYRLLDARDGWNYLATPITANGGK